MTKARDLAKVATLGPAFYAYQTSGNANTLTGNTDVKITLDTELFDTNGNFASSRFTPTVPGYYQISAAITVNYWSGSILSVAIYKNGAYYSVSNTGYPQSVGGVRVVVSTLVYLNGSTGYVELYGYQYNASTSNVTAPSSYGVYMCGSLVRSA